MQYDNKNKGAGWIKISKNNTKYISIKMNIEGKDYNISMFKNNKKTNEKQPDYNLVLSEKKENNNVKNVKDVFTQQTDPWQEDSNISF